MMNRIVLFSLTALTALPAGQIAARILTRFAESAVSPAWHLGSSLKIPEGPVTDPFTKAATSLFSNGKSDRTANDWFSRFLGLEFLYCDIDAGETVWFRAS